MKKQKYNEILRGIIATFVFGSFLSVNTYVNAQDFDGNDSNGKIDISTGVYDNVYGFIDYEKDNVGENREANGASVNITGGTIGNIYGGYAGEANTSNNTGDASAYKNYVSISALCKDNSFEISNIIGGHAWSNSPNYSGAVYANENYVEISDSNIKSSNTVIDNNSGDEGKSYGIIGGDAYRQGGASRDAQANTNTVEITDSDINTIVVGGKIYNKSAGHHNMSTIDNNSNAITETIKNTVILKNSDIGLEKKTSVYGSYIRYDSSGNTAISEINSVHVENSNVNANLYGTYIYSYKCATGNENSNGTDIVLLAADNTVSVQGSSVVGEIKGAYASDYDNRYNYDAIGDRTTAKIIVNMNHAEIEGSTVNGNIYGGEGYTNGSDMTGNGKNDSVTNIEITKNEVEIKDSNIGTTDSPNNIYGGYGY